MLSKDGELLRRAVAVTPLASQTRSKAPGRVGPRDMRAGFPLFSEYGEGPYLIDVEGKRYLDFAGANAAVPLGYTCPEVRNAVRAAVASGPLHSLPSQLEVEVSELLCATIDADRVRWVKTGSEAVSAAVKMARAATGASMVLVGEHSYHGWHDWTYARFTEGVQPGHACLPNGVPSVLGPTIRTFSYGEPGALSGAISAAHAYGRVAAIVIEPHRFMTEQKGWLEQARDAANRIGAVLIFDEMVYGFRWAKAGASQYYGVQPDLACYGKALGNGFPVACVAGKASIIDRTAEYVSGTYGGDRVGLAAALAVLRIHEREDVIGRLWTNGRAFWEAFRAAHDADRPWTTRHVWGGLKGCEVHFAIRWPENHDGTVIEEVVAETLTTCAAQGFLFHRDACNASAAMTEEESAAGGRALATALRAAEAAEEARRETQRRELEASIARAVLER
jgi:glutamate-1-semialdehyde aminotransferase